MDKAHRPGHQLLRHRQRLRLEAGRGHHRADHRPVVRPGRRPSREGRHRHQALRLDERLAQRHQAVGAQHPAWPATRRSSGCRPTSSTSTRCTTSTATPRGTRSGRRSRRCVPQGKILYAGSSNFAGWHLAKAQEAAQKRGLPRPGLRAVHLQPAQPRRSSSRCCRRRSTTAWASSRGARSTAACSAASSARSARAAAATAAGPRRSSRPTDRHRGVRGPLRGARRGAGPRRRWPGCWPGPG